MFVRAFQFHGLLLILLNCPSLNHLRRNRDIDRLDRDHHQFLYDLHSLALLAHILRLQTLRLPVDRHPTILLHQASLPVITQRAFLHS